MKSISKVIVGVAVAGACGYAAAATIGSTGVERYSLESIQTSAATTNVNTGAITITLGQAYVLNDTLELSISGASFGSVDKVTQSFTCEAGGNSTVFSIVTASSGTSLLTYVANTPAGLVPGQSCTVPTVMFSAGSVTAAGDISVSSVSKKAATLASFDSASSAKIASVGSAWTVSGNTVFDGVIDVQNNRLTFASGSGPLNVLGGDATGVDSFAFSINVDDTRVGIDGTTVASAAVTAGTMSLTLTAGTSFGFLVDPVADTAGTCSITGNGAVTASPITGTAVTTVNAACTAITVTVPTVRSGVYAVSLGRGAANSTLTTTNSTAFAEQAYTANVALSLGATATRLASVSGTPSAGAWTINGTTVNIPYLPINSNIDLVVNIANRSTQTGAVTFTAWNASGTSCTGSLGNVTANANMSVGGALKTALLACTGTGWAGATRATVQLVIPTPRATTAVNSSFSASDGKSRSIVVNDTNGYRAN
jgi:hypothetical protein